MRTALTLPAGVPLEPRHVLALSASAGNQAVVRRLMRAPAPPGDVTLPSPPTASPEVMGWDAEITPGPLGQGVARERKANTIKVFAGDTVAVHARFKRLTTADHPYVGGSTLGGRVHVDIDWAKFETARTLTWLVTAKEIGREWVTFQVETSAEPGPNAGQRNYTLFFHVVADLQDFVLRCEEAHAVLGARIGDATRIINQAAGAFRSARAQLHEELQSLKRVDNLGNDLLFGVLFAAAGGAAGARFGQWLKGFVALAKGRDHLVEMTKDTVKFSVRATDKVRGGPSPSSAGDSSSPGADDPTSGGHGKYEPPGDDPLEWLTQLAAQVAGEGAAANSALAGLLKKIRKAREANAKLDFDEDPIAVVSRGTELERLAQLNTDKRYYLAHLWKAWVKANGWQTVDILRKADEAAKAIGESAEDWIPGRPPAEPPHRSGGGPQRPL